MLGTFKQRCAAAVCGLLAAAALGAPAVALADDDVEPTYAPGAAMLTKVIDAPAGTDASQDEYVFHFAGGGTVTESGDSLLSDGVEQDKTTIKVRDTIPTIPDVKLTGVALTDANSLSNGQLSQTVVQKSITSILTENNVVFDHAGVYTYEVTEKSATTKISDGTYINASQAKYVVRIRVENDKTGDSSELGSTALKVANVTVEQVKDDDGEDKQEKVDPTYPKATQAGKITYTSDGVAPEEKELAGDARGREVPGFTFANEYIKGGSFQVKKLYDGAHSDRTKYSSVELAVYSAAAANPNAHGCVLTYVIEGEGVDTTENNQDSDGERLKLNGIYQDIPQVNHYMAKFNDQGWCYLKADLKEGSSIRITGEFGPYNPEYAEEAPNGQDRRMTLSTSGLLQGQTYYVIERYPGDYVPTGYEYVGEDTTVDPRVEETGMTATQKLDSAMTDETDPIPENQPSYTQATLEAGSLFVKGSATGSATTVFVVNVIDEDTVNPTGILISNLPYILMVGVPLAVFAVMFVSRRRRNLAA